MLAPKWFHPVPGIDIHIVMMPTPAGAAPIPVPGVAFQKGMPSMDADLMFGGLKVSFGGSHIVRLGDIALSCSDPMRMPTSVVLAIPLGSLVIVPRPPSPDLMGLVFAAGGKLVAKLASKA